jgi:hypothetical protein
MKGTIPVSLTLSIIFVIPIGAVMAVSGYETTLEIWLELVRSTVLLIEAKAQEND